MIPGVVCTFYSYKGGVGRTMALANVAAELARLGNRVLVLDWDLEAPGIEKYFEDANLGQTRFPDGPGILELIYACVEDVALDWKECVIHATPFPAAQVDIIRSGERGNGYVGRLQAVNWSTLFEEHEFGLYLERLRCEWVAEYDYVLVDSRTGITDIGGICTIHLPDVLAVFFTANEQSVAGVRDVLDRAREKRQLLPFDRAALRAIPVPTRFENYTELRLAREWKTVFAKEFDEYYREWLPATTTAREALEKLFLPYVPFWSFGERLPVVYEGASDPRSLGSAYSFVSRLLNHHLDWDATTRNFGAAAESRNAAAIAAEAEQIYVELADADRIGAKRLFLRLVWTNPSSDQVISAGEVPTRMLGLVSETVLAKYRDAGIIEVQSQEEREDLVELAVPEIIESWARLSRWIDADRELLRWRQSISPHVQVFATKDKPSRSDYLSGATLARAKELATKPHLINPIEKRLVSKSVERAARGELQRLAAAGITLTLAVGLAVTTISQRRLQQERLEAEQSLRVTQAFLRQQIEVSTESLQVNQQRLQALTDSLEAFRTRSRTSTATR